MIREAIYKLMDRQDLTLEESEEVINDIMDGNASPAQSATFLTALRLKGETVAEITGCARAMRNKAIAVKPNRTDLVDTAGTGGDRAGTFNISTTAAFVIAGSGLGVAKHGNRAVSGQCGSADVMEALGVRLDLTPEQVARCIDEVGIGFLFAPRLHPAMKTVGPIRKELGVRTIFNILGPLTNPARARAQIVGVFDSSLTEPLAKVLHELGCRAAFVFHSADGLDELTTTGINHLTRFDDGALHTQDLDARDLGLRRSTRDELAGGNAVDNARITRSILSGEDRGPKRDVVLLNAAAGLVAGGADGDLSGALRHAAETIDSGRAQKALDDLVSASQLMQA